MPTGLRDNGYRFAFYGADRGEPAHVHVTRDRNKAKFWLEPFIRLSKNKGFRSHELNEIEKILERNKEQLMRTWDEYFES